MLRWWTASRGSAIFEIVAGAVVLALCWRALAARTPGLKRSTDQVLGHLLEIGVYSDLPREMLVSLARLTRACAIATLRTVPLLLAFLIPCALVLVPLRACQERRPIRPGEAFLLSAPTSDLHLPPGLLAESSSIESQGEYYWRLRAQRAGNYPVRVGALATTVQVGTGQAWLRDGPLTVDYPRRVYAHEPWTVWLLLGFCCACLVFR